MSVLKNKRINFTIHGTDVRLKVRAIEHRTHKKILLYISSKITYVT